MQSLDWVYLIHFSQPISERHTCQHYLGAAVNPYTRLTQHQEGTGARLTQVANERGIAYRIVRVWHVPGQARELERKLKNRKNAPGLCPVCAAKRKHYQLPLLNELGEVDFYA